MKEKLQFVGKINLIQTRNWEIIGISYNPYSFTELKLHIRNQDEKYKIIYSEERKKYRDKRIPVIRSRELSFVKVFDLKVKKIEIESIQESNNVEFFPIKKAS